MHIPSTVSAPAFALATACLLFYSACTESQPAGTRDEPKTMPTSGIAAAGGTQAPAGGTQAGGASATGGTSAAGGMTATGGTSGGGGTPAAGGTTGPAGTGGAGGAGGAIPNGGTTATAGAGGTVPAGGATRTGGAEPTGSGPIGFASLEDWGQKGTTGGLGGPEVTPTTAAELIKYLKQAGPLIIKIKGKIDLGRKLAFAEVSSHKSILGVGEDATITGSGLGIGIHLWDARDTLTDKPETAAGNIIVRNIHFESTVRDPIEIQLFSHHIWIDHCKFSNPNGGGDGRGIDVKRGANYITISYNVFEANLGEAGVVGANATTTVQEQGRQKVTMHHNWWKGLKLATVQVFHGQTHYFNNYWSGTQEYAIGISKLANVFTENGVLEGGTYVKEYIPETGPLTDAATLGGLKDVGTIGGSSLRPEKVTFNPSEAYTYTAMPADAVKAEVMANAGVGKITP